VARRPFALARFKHGGPRFPSQHAAHFPVPCQLFRASFTFHLLVTPGSARASLRADLLPAPTREPAYQPSPANRRLRCGGWLRRPAPPPASLWPAVSRPVSLLLVVPTGSAGPWVADACCWLPFRPALPRPVSPEPPPWTSRTVSAASGWAPRRTGGGVACAGGLFTISRWPCGLCSAGPRPPACPPRTWSPHPSEFAGLWEAGRPLAAASRPRPPSASSPGLPTSARPPARRALLRPGPAPPRAEWAPSV
jgi:hypothetical protein